MAEPQGLADRRGALGRLLRPPIEEFLDGFERCLDSGWSGLAWLAFGLVVGWWIYVPIHELLHAGACLAAGGSVQRLEIAGLYGGHLLEHVFPFVVAGGDYAGRLSGFDTGGSDLVYLATDFGPFVLTLFPGVWALRRAGRKGRPFGFGFALPFALAPLVSLTGDAYEIGSLTVAQLPWWGRELISDDVFRLAEEFWGTSGAPWSGLILAFGVGTLWALLTCWLGWRIARALDP